MDPIPFDPNSQQYSKAKEKVVSYLTRSDQKNIMLKHAIGNIGIAYICAFPDIHTLSLNYANITPQGLRQLPKAKWQNITVIDLGLNAIGNKGCKMLSRVSWSSLKKIYLTEAKIQDDGVSHLAKGVFPRLTVFDIAQNRITAEGIFNLKRGHWKHLKSLNIYNFFRASNSKDSIVNRQGLNGLLLCEWPQVVIKHFKQNRRQQDAFFESDSTARECFKKILIQKFPKCAPEWQQLQRLRDFY